MRFGAALTVMAVWAAAAPPARPTFHNPIEIALSRDGLRLFVVCESANAIAVLDLRSGVVVRRIPTGRVPKGIAVSPDGRMLYVANSWDDTVTEIDSSRLAVVRTLRAGFEPNGLAPDPDGKHLYVANRISNDISVIDLAAGEDTRRLPAGRGASYLGAASNGRFLYSTHILPNPGQVRAAPQSEITVIDSQSRTVSARIRLPNAAGVFHVALSTDGTFGLAAHLRPKNLVPLAHVAHGWAFTHSLALFGEEFDDPVAVPLDELERYTSLPFGVAISPDNRSAYVSASGSNSVVAIDLERLFAMIRPLDARGRARLANDLAASAQYVRARIPVGRNPKGIALSADGLRLYVANRLDDTISVIDTVRGKVISTIALGGPAPVTPERRGERLFYDSRFSFQGQFGCAHCHIEGTFDGLSWDLEPDGFGIEIVDNKLLEAVDGTEPYKWNGGNPDLETECGPRTEKFFYRSQSYSPRELADLVRFIKSIPARPNRFRQRGGELTAAQERGKVIFERTRRKDGSPIPEDNQCLTCHSGPKYTNQLLTDVGSFKPTDRSPMIDVPHLVNVALSAPYLHDGSARSLEEIWTVFNPRDTHGVTNDLTKDELNDLIEYLKTL